LNGVIAKSEVHRYLDPKKLLPKIEEICKKEEKSNIKKMYMGIIKKK
jgi:hypothetical protein